MATTTDEVRQLLEKQPQQRRDDFTAVRSELAQYVSEMKDLRQQDPDDAMAWLSSVSARVLELRLFTLQSEGRLATKLRVEELIPITEEIRFQFQIASRRTTITALDWEFSGKQAT